MPAQMAAETCDLVRLVRHPHNLGGSAARNTGIDAATGDLIALCDVDDLWLPHKLSAQISALTNAAGDHDGDWDKCFSASNCLLEYANGERKRCNKQPPDDKQPLWRYFLEQDGALQTSTLVVPANLAKRVRFRAGLARHQDWDFVIRLQQAGARLIYLHDCLSVYRLRKDPVRVSRNPRAALNSVIWFRQMLGQIEADVMQRFFFSKLITRSGIASPVSMARATLGAIALSPGTTFKSLIAAYRSRRR